MFSSNITRLRRTASLLVLLALAACGGDGGGGGGEPDGRRETGVGALSARPGMTRTEYLALPDSARLGEDEDSGAFTTDRGVGVEVDVFVSGQEGKQVPLAYSLHDARNDVHFISQTVPLTPDAPQWRRRGYVWLPVPSPGTYYVRVVLADSTGRSTTGPRTETFTIQ